MKHYPQKSRPSREDQARVPVHVDSPVRWKDFEAARVRLILTIVQEGGDTWENTAKRLSVTEEDVLAIFHANTHGSHAGLNALTDYIAAYTGPGSRRKR